MKLGSRDILERPKNGSPLVCNMAHEENIAPSVGEPVAGVTHASREDRRPTTGRVDTFFPQLLFVGELLGLIIELSHANAE